MSEKINMKAAADFSRNNLLNIFGQFLMELTKGTLNPMELKDGDENYDYSLFRRYETSGVLYQELLAMLTNAGLDDYGADILLSCILDLLEIMGYPKPLPEAVQFFTNRVLQAYALAVRYSTSQGLKTFYRFVSVLNEKSTRIDDEVLIDESFLDKMKKTVRKTDKKVKTDQND